MRTFEGWISAIKFGGNPKVNNFDNAIIQIQHYVSKVDIFMNDIVPVFRLFELFFTNTDTTSTISLTELALWITDSFFWLNLRNTIASADSCTQVRYNTIIINNDKIGSFTYFQTTAIAK